MERAVISAVPREPTQAARSGPPPLARGQLPFRPGIDCMRSTETTRCCMASGRWLLLQQGSSGSAPSRPAAPPPPSLAARLSGRAARQRAPGAWLGGSITQSACYSRQLHAQPLCMTSILYSLLNLPFRLGTMVLNSCTSRQFPLVMSTSEFHEYAKKHPHAVGINCGGGLPDLVLKTAEQAGHYSRHFAERALAYENALHDKCGRTRDVV